MFSFDLVLVHFLVQLYIFDIYIHNPVTKIKDATAGKKKIVRYTNNTNDEHKKYLGVAET